MSASVVLPTPDMPNTVTALAGHSRHSLAVLKRIDPKPTRAALIADAPYEGPVGLLGRLCRQSAPARPEDLNADAEENEGREAHDDVRPVLAEEGAGALGEAVTEVDSERDR